MTSPAVPTAAEARRRAWTRMMGAWEVRVRVPARGRTALDLALEYGHDAVADLLARKGTPFGDRGEAERADDASRRDASRSAEPSAPPAPTPESARESVSPLDGLDRRGIVVSAPPLVSASETQVVRRGMEGSGDGNTPARNEGPLLSPE